MSRMNYLLVLVVSFLMLSCLLPLTSWASQLVLSVRHEGETWVRSRKEANQLLRCPNLVGASWHKLQNCQEMKLFQLFIKKTKDCTRDSKAQIWLHIYLFVPSVRPATPVLQVTGLLQEGSDFVITCTTTTQGITSWRFSRDSTTLAFTSRNSLTVSAAQKGRDEGIYSCEAYSGNIVSDAAFSSSITCRFITLSLMLHYYTTIIFSHYS